MRLTQSQLSTIVLAGIIGQYPFAALAGEIVDRVGTWACSGCAAVLSATGYGLSVWIIEHKIPPDAYISPAGFRILVVAYCLLGFGSVFSYFSAVFSAVKAFPTHNGLAMGTALALVGLSPLFLSLPSGLFTTPAGYVDAKRFILSIGILTTFMTTFSTFGLRCIKSDIPSTTILVVPDAEDVDEETPLVPKQVPYRDPPQPWMSVLGDGYFWWLFIVVAAMLGSVRLTYSLQHVIAMNLRIFLG